MRISSKQESYGCIFQWIWWSDLWLTKAYTRINLVSYSLQRLILVSLGWLRHLTSTERTHISLWLFLLVKGHLCFELHFHPHLGQKALLNGSCAGSPERLALFCKGTTYCKASLEEASLLLPMQLWAMPSQNKDKPIYGQGSYYLPLSISL